MQNERKSAKSRFVLGFIAASALWIVLILVVMQYLRTPLYQAPATVLVPLRGPASPALLMRDAPGTRDSVAALVAQRLTALHVPAKKATLPSDLALQAEIAIKKGDFPTANRIASDVLARSKLTGWRFYPFDSFMDTLVGPGNDPQMQSQLHEWRQQDPNSALAYLISAQYFRATGWTVRGGVGLTRFGTQVGL